MPGIEPGAFHMQSERSTTEPHPHIIQIYTHNCYPILRIYLHINVTKKLKSAK